MVESVVQCLGSSSLSWERSVEACVRTISLKQISPLRRAPSFGECLFLMIQWWTMILTKHQPIVMNWYYSNIIIEEMSSKLLIKEEKNVREWSWIESFLYVQDHNLLIYSSNPWLYWMPEKWPFNTFGRVIILVMVANYRLIHLNNHRLHSRTSHLNSIQFGP